MAKETSLKEGQGFFVGNYDHIRVELQDGSRNLWRDRSVEGIVDRLCLCLTTGKQEDLFCFHDTADPHGNGMCRNFIHRGKEAGIGTSGIFGKGYHMGCLDIRVSRLVETDMTIATDTEQLQVDAAAGSDQIIICLAGFLWILGQDPNPSS